MMYERNHLCAHTEIWIWSNYEVPDAYFERSSSNLFMSLYIWDKQMCENVFICCWISSKRGCKEQFLSDTYVCNH